MESHFQAIMGSGQPEADLKEYVDELYSLLIETNKGIEAFSNDLDTQLARKKAQPNFRPHEPLGTPTYKRLLKMWNLKEQYITELSYFYYRLMTLRIARDENHQLTPAARVARKIQVDLENHLKTTQNSRRVELQELMERLHEVFQVFVAELKARRLQTATPGAPTENSTPEEITGSGSEPGFAEALFKSPEELKAYIDENQVRDIPQLTPREKAARTKFLKIIESRLATIPEPKHDERKPQSVQDTSCQPGHRLCVSTGDTGNIIGSLLPKGNWAFTFDDGPAAQSTSDMMELVHGYSDSVNPVGKATFFQLAKNVRAYPQWVKKGFAYGFPLENHSYTHADLHSLKTDRHHEIVDANQVLTDEYHKVDPNYVIQYFRCPYGSCYAPKVPEARQLIADQKQIHVYWRIDSLDWKLLNGPKVADLVEKQIQLLDHGVILMHDIHPTTVDAMRIILPWLKKQNDELGKHYKMVTIPEVVDIINGTTSN